MVEIKHFGYSTGYSAKLVAEAAKDAILAITPIANEMRGKFTASGDPKLVQQLHEIETAIDELIGFAENANSMDPCLYKTAIDRIAERRNHFVYG